jgi:hypothetical protein
MVLKKLFKEDTEIREDFVIQMIKEKTDSRYRR